MDRVANQDWRVFRGLKKDSRCVDRRQVTLLQYVVVSTVVYGDYKDTING